MEEAKAGGAISVGGVVASPSSSNSSNAPQSTTYTVNNQDVSNKFEDLVNKWFADEWMVEKAEPRSANLSRPLMMMSRGGDNNWSSPGVNDSHHGNPDDGDWPKKHKVTVWEYYSSQFYTYKSDNFSLPIFCGVPVWKEGDDHDDKLHFGEIPANELDDLDKDSKWGQYYCGKINDGQTYEQMGRQMFSQPFDFFTYNPSYDAVAEFQFPFQSSEAGFLRNIYAGYEPTCHFLNKFTSDLVYMKNWPHRFAYAFRKNVPRVLIVFTNEFDNEVERTYTYSHEEGAKWGETTSPKYKYWKGGKYENFSGLSAGDCPFDPFCLQTFVPTDFVKGIGDYIYKCDFGSYSEDLRTWDIDGGLYATKKLYEIVTDSGNKPLQPLKIGNGKISYNAIRTNGFCELQDSLPKVTTPTNVYLFTSDADAPKPLYKVDHPSYDEDWDEETVGNVARSLYLYNDEDFFEQIKNIKLPSEATNDSNMTWEKLMQYNAKFLVTQYPNQLLDVNLCKQIQYIFGLGNPYTNMNFVYVRRAQNTKFTGTFIYGISASDMNAAKSMNDADKGNAVKQILLNSRVLEEDDETGKIVRGPLWGYATANNPPNMEELDEDERAELKEKMKWIDNHLSSPAIFECTLPNADGTEIGKKQMIEKGRMCKFNLKYDNFELVFCQLSGNNTNGYSIKSVQLNNVTHIFSGKTYFGEKTKSHADPRDYSTIQYGYKEADTGKFVSTGCIKMICVAEALPSKNTAGLIVDNGGIL